MTEEFAISRGDGRGVITSRKEGGRLAEGLIIGLKPVTYVMCPGDKVSLNSHVDPNSPLASNVVILKTFICFSFW